VAATRFLSDVSLELLARRLRALGFDAAPAGNVRLEELLERARREDRIALTTSARHPRRYADVPTVVVAREDPAGSVRSLAEIYEPAGPPFSRCTLCNRELERAVSATAPAAAVPESVRKSDLPLRRCGSCGRWYWNGGHVARLEAWLERALGAPLPAPRVS
jgi:uncharacterized protein with PIN domain